MTHQFELLKELLTAFYKLTSINIAVFDLEFEQIFGCPEESSIFCEAIRSCPEYHADCGRCDHEAVQRCKREEKPYTYICHCGLTESIFPIMVDNEIFGYIMLGQVLINGKNVRMEKLLRFFSEAESRRLADSLTKKSMEEIEAAAMLMEACGSYDVIRRAMQESGDYLVERFKRYVSGNLGGDLSIAAICRGLKISRSYLYESITPKINCTVKQYIGEARNRKATALLQSSAYSVSEIAELCGYADYNYFSRVYKKRNGLSPTALRKKFNGAH